MQYAIRQISQIHWQIIFFDSSVFMSNDGYNYMNI